MRTLLILALTFLSLGVAAAKPAPNVIFILTDNHGAWTLGCYGNKEIRTPNIDKLAAEGTLFTRAFCNNSVCSPSRATFLTGLIPSQHGVHAYIPQAAQTGPEAYSTIAEFRTLPKILSEAGYVCGLSGKWHLGDNLNPQEGFTYWFTKEGGHTTTFYNDSMIWKNKVYKEPKYTTEAITDHAVEFLVQQKSDKPFFLYLAYNGPYGLGKVVMEEHRNRHTAYYADKEMNSYPRAEGVSPWLKSNRAAVNNVQSMRTYAAAVSGVDDGVGRVMEKLKELGFDKNTLVVFSADQGLNAGHNGYWGMGDHSRPINTLDSTVRIPLIFRHPQAVASGKTSDLMVHNHDFLPTVLDHVGLKEMTPGSPQLPGKSFAPVLRGEKVEWENVIYHDFENTRMIRTPKWKLTIRYPHGPDDLYDMENDPGEKENLIYVGQHSAAKNQLKKKLETFFAKYADPKYDRWNGGATKGTVILK
ncbi:MAG: sulfatase-like hydrolase/transferase [Verrucomicrobia bacterium]|nr:sulfatase-like hydrolase/transferase [Verrucomicrobiota bacterium]